MISKEQAAEYGRQGGKIGGKAKVPKGIAKLTPEQRSALGKYAAQKKKEKKQNESGG